MKKILVPLVLLVMGTTSNAQSDKKEPPPPPPKPKEEVKYKLVKDEKVKVPPVITVSGTMAEEFYKRNPTVSEISRQGNIISLKMKDGTTEKYDMSKKDEDKSFTEKYGSSPIPPPPPPKPKQEVKYKIVKDEKVIVPPVIIVSGKNEFYTRNPTVSEISRQGNIITLKMKDGTTEKYDMSKKDEEKSFTEKYGTSPIPPPPPPPKVIKTKSRA